MDRGGRAEPGPVAYGYTPFRRLYGQAPLYRHARHEIYSTYYDISYPAHERSSARKLRLSPVYTRLEELGAVFGEKAGWERPNWFASNEALAAGQRLADRVAGPGATGRRPSARSIGDPRTSGMFDKTSFSKIEVLGSGRDGLPTAHHRQSDGATGGRITYTQMLNERGGIECDLTVTRLAGDRFQIVTGTAFGKHDLGWIRASAGLMMARFTS